ncbi:endonuclease/exonuclease/phosphatase family protein [Pontibacter sp. 172403-2]|nr:endonuclease/exonuclease/phosphatase family protein [Pontibacter sp. 172403-2]
MSYNIHHCNPPAKSDFIDVNAIVNVINAEKPDLLALQEVDVNTDRSGAVNQAQEIANKLHMHYFFGKAIDYQGGAYGVAILSKYPLTEAVVHQLPVKAGTNGEPRVLATAKVTLPDGAVIRFGSTHLDAQSDPANRRLQVDELTEIAAGESLPFIIAGDFNATPDSEVINRLDTQFKRTCQICAPTIPATNPGRAIDFIAYRHPANKFSVASHRVINEQYASDHRPVVAVINVEE